MKQNAQKMEAKIDGIFFKEGRTEALASVILGNGAVLHGVRVLDVDGDIDISIPLSAYAENGEIEVDVDITEEKRTAIIQAVDIAYAQELEERQAQVAPEPSESMTM